MAAPTAALNACAARDRVDRQVRVARVAQPEPRIAAMLSSACTRERGSPVRFTESRHTIAFAGACAATARAAVGRASATRVRRVRDRVAARPPVGVARDEHVRGLALEERARGRIRRQPLVARRRRRTWWSIPPSQL